MDFSGVKFLTLGFPANASLLGILFWSKYGWELPFEYYGPPMLGFAESVKERAIDWPHQSYQKFEIRYERDKEDSGNFLMGFLGMLGLNLGLGSTENWKFDFNMEVTDMDVSFAAPAALEELIGKPVPPPIALSAVKLVICHAQLSARKGNFKIIFHDGASEEFKTKVEGIKGENIKLDMGKSSLDKGELVFNFEVNPPVVFGIMVQQIDEKKIDGVRYFNGFGQKDTNFHFVRLS